MAHIDTSSGYHVGRYGVDLDAIDRVVELALVGGDADVALIDDP